ncbi:CaiB/BaiF CoA-transferase family protein [Aeromicrobium ginsengisoli]|uniref:CoA transferase n=1 Tax=Aeromicrobium ginsengisoli TaxID=363867 RepID=A0A5M4FAI7_9ACTN|nr:CoA transferase [Aeromicrobium ginsengisoli]KAA1394221.1 CoA transferase [Aeromicrobium ginsengisoli]
MSSLPLADVRVLDVADAAGEAATRLLADLGADVVKVEPLSGAPTRSRGPVVKGRSLEFAVSNANKRSGSADVANRADLDALRAFSADADIVVLDRSSAAHLDPERLLAAAPHLVVVVSTPFGRTGPRSEWSATSRTFLALSGALSRSGRPGDVPLVPPGEIAAASAASQLAWTALVGLIAVRRGGPGQIIDLAQQEAVVTGLDPAFGVQGSAAAGRSGKFRRGRPPADSYPIYPCKDGYVRLCLLAKRQWRGMFAWLGEPTELADPKYDSIAERFRAADLIDPLIMALFADQPGAVLVDEAARRGVPLAQVLTLGDALTSVHFTTAGTIAPTDLAPELEACPTPVGCVDLDGKRLGIHSPAPAEPAAGLPAWLTRATSTTSLLSPSPLPFAGVRVLDLGVIVFGAEIGRMFADLGADVIKVESLAFPDGLRQTRGGEAMNASFAWGQRNKRSLGLDLRSTGGQTLFHDLAASSDIVLSNFKPGTLHSLGIGHEDLKRLNPRIVVVESAAFSAKGPWSQRLGYGPLVRAACGITSLWRYAPGDVESWDGVTVFPDHVAAKVGALVAAAALLRAVRTGSGARIELAQSDVVLHQLAARAVEEALVPGSAVAAGNRGRELFGGLFPCNGDDEWALVEARDDDELARLAGVVGTGADRDLHDAVTAWTSTRAPHEVMERLQEAGVPAAAMVRLPELLDDPQLQHRGTFATLHHPVLDHELPTEAVASVYGVAPPLLLGPAPAVGEHTREVCRDVLGLSEDRIERLLADGVLHEGAPVVAVNA